MLQRASDMVGVTEHVFKPYEIVKNVNRVFDIVFIVALEFLHLQQGKYPGGPL
jgi:hypothetical protein